MSNPEMSDNEEVKFSRSISPPKSPNKKRNGKTPMDGVKRRFSKLSLRDPSSSYVEYTSISPDLLKTGKYAKTMYADRGETPENGFLRADREALEEEIRMIKQERNALIQERRILKARLVHQGGDNLADLLARNGSKSPQKTKEPKSDNDNEQFRAALERSQTEIARLKAESIKYRGDASKYKSQVQKLRDQLQKEKGDVEKRKKMEHDAAEINQQIEVLSQHIGELERRWKSEETKNETLNKEIEQSKAQNLELQRKVKYLNEELSRARNSEGDSEDAQSDETKWDVWENSDKILVVVDIPSVNSKEIDVQIGYKSLQLRWQKGVFEKRNILQRFTSVSNSRFKSLDKMPVIVSQNIALPHPIDVTDKNVYAENGTLYITLTKLADEVDEEQEDESEEENEEKDKDEEKEETSEKTEDGKREDAADNEKQPADEGKDEKDNKSEDELDM